MAVEGSRLPGAVLFACNLNRVRSPMAEALLKQLVGDRIYVDSCGLASTMTGADGSGIDPFVAAVMAELGGDLAGHHPKTFEDLEDSSFDLIVSLTPEAHDRAMDLAHGRAIEIEYWPTLDPTQMEGSRERRLEAYREVRDALARRIAERFGLPGSAPIDLAPHGAL
jgi:protein-tyrosine-phosphatase